MLYDIQPSLLMLPSEHFVLLAAKLRNKNFVSD